MSDEPGELTLIAYHGVPKPQMQIVPASRWREWMNQTIARGANRCLPLLVANEAGWFLLNEKRFEAEWNGGSALTDLEVRYDGPQPAGAARSNFGDGLLTFSIPYLFRTDPGFELLVRGPANMPRDGLSPLDGLVETDWALASFTMNWAFTRPGTVAFEADEPICMIVPQRRADLEAFRPQVRSVTQDDEKIGEAWAEAARQRHEMQVRNWLADNVGAQISAKDSWSGDYFRGRTILGDDFPDHVTKRRLEPFQHVEAPARES
jgi:hypothetical protein